MKYTITIVVLVLLSNTAHADFYMDVAKFCHMNGLNYISLSSSPYLRDETHQMIAGLWNHGLMVRQNSFDNVRKSYVLDGAGCLEKKVVCPLDTQLYQDTIVLMAKSDQLKNEESFQSYLSLIAISKVKRGLIIFTTPFSAEHKSLLNDMIDALDANSLFYIAYKDAITSKTKYMQVITIRRAGRGILNDVKVTRMGQIIENYDMQGLKIMSLTLPWAPFFTIKNCDSEGKNCEMYGFYGDLMTEMGRVMNFTWDSHADPDGNWGVRPISGPVNMSGVWGGAMGSVVNGDYPISLSQWVWTVNRYGLLDFVSTSADTFLCVLTPKPPEVDTGLFIRPFTDDAWNGE